MKVSRLFSFIKTVTYYTLIFKGIGVKSVLKSPLKIDGSKRILIGNSVYIAYKTWLAAVPLTDSKKCELIIGDGCKIGNFNHIYSTGSVILEPNVLTADKVYISDNLHSYKDIKIPIWQQPIKQIGNVVIGEGTWLGENVCVIGASVGKQCVIGANSVVTKDIPDYCVAVGSPAKVIKRYNTIKGIWEKE